MDWDHIVQFQKILRPFDLYRTSMKLTMVFMSEPLISFIAVKASKTIPLYLEKNHRKKRWHKFIGMWLSTSRKNSNYTRACWIEQLGLFGPIASWKVNCKLKVFSKCYVLELFIFISANNSQEALNRRRKFFLSKTRVNW